MGHKVKSTSTCDPGMSNFCSADTSCVLQTSASLRSTLWMNSPIKELSQPDLSGKFLFYQMNVCIFLYIEVITVTFCAVQIYNITDNATFPIC